MTAIQAANALYTPLGLFAIAGLWCFGWRKWALDAFRQDLYEARDRLFDLAAENAGPFSFEHPRYGQLRRQLHVAIRFAHRVNTLKAVVFWITRRIIGPQESPSSVESGGCDTQLDGAAEAAVAEVMKMGDQALIRFLSRTSPLFYFAFASFFARAVFRGFLRPDSRNFVKQNSVSVASSSVSATVWAEVAIADACEDQRHEDTLAILT